MTRVLTVAAAQLGPVQRSDARKDVVGRLIAHLREAKKQDCALVVFPELALTTFFPRWFMNDQQEIDRFFESEMPNQDTRPLFDEAKRLQLAFMLGYAERHSEKGRIHHYNTSILVDSQAHIVGKYRKVHLPGHAEHEPQRPFQHLEQRYFERGEGFSVWEAFDAKIGMCLCNDRRWPESYRVMGLQGAELILLGYNTPKHYPPAPEFDEHAMFHNHLVMQAGAHQNGSWVVAAAKAGNEEDIPMIGGSCIISPSGHIVAQAETESDELVVASCDLDLAQRYKHTLFNFQSHRYPPAYTAISNQ